MEEKNKIIISYIENSEYNIIIKWLPDMSGIELVLNKEIYKKYCK